MKKLHLVLSILIALTASPAAQAQTPIKGKWQLIKQSECITDDLAPAEEEEESLLREMKSRGGETAGIITFGDKGNGEQSTRILHKRKSTGKTSFLYRFDGETLYILDKKSRTIDGSFLVDKISSDSLIVSDAARPCDTKIFIRIKEARTN